MKEKKKLDFLRGGEWIGYIIIILEINGCKYEYICCWSCESCLVLFVLLFLEGGDDDGGVVVDFGLGFVGFVIGGGGSFGFLGILVNFILKIFCKERSDYV